MVVRQQNAGQLTGLETRGQQRQASVEQDALVARLYQRTARRTMITPVLLRALTGAAVTAKQWRGGDATGAEKSEFN